MKVAHLDFEGWGIVESRSWKGQIRELGVVGGGFARAAWAEDSGANPEVC